MDFTTILVGNGLGRAINNDFFDLQNAIESHWHNGDEFLDDNAKDSILKCLSQTRENAEIPTSEDDLLILQEAVAACQTLLKIEKSDEVWLTQFGQLFPDIINQFIGKTAFHFHNYNVEELPDNYEIFLSGIKNFIQSRKCHLATLNYDNLLYQPLIEAEILKGYSGNLIDGFWNSTGFDESNMIRTTNPDQGWYMHLHGSPLFYDQDGKIKKMSQVQLSNSFNGVIKRRHVVLTHVSKKSGLIASSPLLNSYFQHFGQALNESDKLVVYGYSGADEHINKRIQDWVKFASAVDREIEIYIVERKKDGEQNKRLNFWRKRLSPSDSIDVEINLISKYDNILDLDWTEIS